VRCTRRDFASFVELIARRGQAFVGFFFERFVDCLPGKPPEANPFKGAFCDLTMGCAAGYGIAGSGGGMMPKVDQGRLLDALGMCEDDKALPPPPKKKKNCNLPPRRCSDN
jgi:hypothetical protein